MKAHVASDILSESTYIPSSESFFIQNTIVAIKIAATENIPTDIEEDADLAKVAKQVKAVNLFTSQKTVTVKFPGSKRRLRA